jgi:hypothetical protein
MARLGPVLKQHESPPKQQNARTVVDSLAAFQSSSLAKTPGKAVGPAGLRTRPISGNFELILGSAEGHLADASNNVLERRHTKAYKRRVDEEIEIIDDAAVKLNVPKFAWPAFRAMIQNFRNAIPLPEIAPEYYEPRKEPVVDFLRRVWKNPWIDQGTLTRPALRRLDSKCEMALRNWLREDKNELPPDLRISSKTESLTRELENPERVRDAYRLARADYLRKSTSPR